MVGCDPANAFRQLCFLTGDDQRQRAVCAEVFPGIPHEVHRQLHHLTVGDQGVDILLSLHGPELCLMVFPGIIACARFLFMDEIGSAAIPGLGKLGFPIFPMGGLQVGAGGGVVGIIDIFLQLLAEEIAHDGDQVAAGIGGGVFQVGVFALRRVAVFHGHGYCVAGGKLLPDAFEAGVMHIAFIAEGACAGAGEAPVAVAAVAIVKGGKCDLLRQNICALPVQQHGHTGGGADHAAVIRVADGLRDGGRIQQDGIRDLAGALRQRAGRPPVGIIGVFEGCGHQTQHRLRRLGAVGPYDGLQLEGGGGKTVGDVQGAVACAAEGIGIGPAVFIAAAGGMAVGVLRAAALDKRAPFAPGDPVGPAVVGLAAVGPAIVIRDIGPAIDLNGGPAGRVGVPGGYQIVPGEGLVDRGDIDALRSAGLQLQSTVAHGGRLQIGAFPDGKVLRRGDLDKIALQRNIRRRCR